MNETSEIRDDSVSDRTSATVESNGISEPDDSIKSLDVSESVVINEPQNLLSTDDPEDSSENIRPNEETFHSLLDGNGKEVEVEDEEVEDEEVEEESYTDNVTQSQLDPQNVQVTATYLSPVKTIQKGK